MSKDAYGNLLDPLEPASKVVSKKSMLKATREIQDHKDSGDISNSTCMFDGTWQRRGFSSLVGLVACISGDNSKVIDLEIMRKTCTKYRIIARMYEEGSAEFLKKMGDQQCDRNYE